MKFCSNCGTQLQSANPKFCPECGASLLASPVANAPAIQVSPHVRVQPEKTSATQDDDDLPPKLNIYDLGIQLESTTASIFEKMGYSVKTRQHVSTKSGAPAEIDILLERGSRRKAVECKNYDPSRSVGASDLRVFKDKLTDTGIFSGVFVTNTSFSEDATKLADSVGMELWDGDELRERFFAYSIGRIRNPSLVQDPVLPIQLDFNTASTLSLRNKDVVHLFSSVLLYHPYIQVKYRLHATRNDTTGRAHVVSDSGTYYLDALDGDIINAEKGMMDTIGGLFSNKGEKIASKEDKMVLEDLEGIAAQTKPVLSTSDYQVSVAEAAVSEADAVKIVKAHVVENNKQDVKYNIKVKGEIESRSLTIVPRLNEVSIRGTRLVYVPKWNLEYEAGQSNFSRRFLASSGRPIEDEMAKCSKCSLMKKQTVAVCEQCGRTLCEKHAYQEGRLLCEDHVSEAMKEQIKGTGLFSRLRFGRN